jgi:exonuclease SbcC
VVARVEQAEHLVVENELTGPGSGAEVIPADADASIDARLDALRRARAGRTTGLSSAARSGTWPMPRTEQRPPRARPREERQAQAEQDRARTALAALDADADRIAADRRTLEDARAAEALRHVLSTAERTAAAAATATSLAARPGCVAGDRRRRRRGPGEASAEALRAWAADRTRASGAAQQAASAEGSSPPTRRR